MGHKLIFTLVFSLAFSVTQAQRLVSNDVKTTKAVTENTVAQVAIEKIHNLELDSVMKKQKKIAEYTAKMAVIKDLYRASMQNVEGFGQETQIYKEIVAQATDIFVNLPIATAELSKQPLSIITTLKEVQGIGFEAQSLVRAFVKIVNNGKVSFKMKNLSIAGSDDGYNYINRTDRMIMANDILTRLTDINYKIQGLIYLARFCNGLSDLIYTLDVDTWCAYFDGKNRIENIIQLYKDL